MIALIATPFFLVVAAKAYIRNPPAYTEARVRLPVAQDRDLIPEENIRYKIIRAALEAGIDPDTAVRIARCESSLDPFAKNKHSSAAGLYQWTQWTWEYIGAPGSPYDVDESIRQFMIHFPKHPGWWVCK